MQVERFPVYFKQRDNRFYSATSFVMPATLMRIPYSLTEAVVWTVITYWIVGMAPEASRCVSDCHFLYNLLSTLVPGVHIPI